MLYFSAIINSNASERNNKPVLNVRFSIRDEEHIGLKFYVILIHRTEFSFPSYENQKQKTSQGSCQHYKVYFFIILKFTNSFSRKTFHWFPDN